MLHSLTLRTYIFPRRLLLGLVLIMSEAKAADEGCPITMKTLHWTLDLGTESRSLPAIEQAVTLLLQPNDEPESPLNNVLSLVEGQGDDSLQRAQELLRAHLNKAETKLVLLSGKDDGRGIPPERGESTGENWVFSLTIPSLSDHIYWIVLPKKPQSTLQGYVYGFN